MISPTAVGAPAPEEPGAESAEAPIATPAHTIGAAATVIRQALHKAPVLVMLEWSPLFSSSRASTSAWRASSVCDHIETPSRLAPIIGASYAGLLGLTKKGVLADRSAGRRGMISHRAIRASDRDPDG
jgi:hypothetical protein